MGRRIAIQRASSGPLVGFPAQGTLARFLDEGAKAVRIQGEEIKVAARIRRIDDYSGHADCRGEPRPCGPID
jgi:metallo-beta-lactamase family protein